MALPINMRADSNVAQLAIMAATGTAAETSLCMTSVKHAGTAEQVARSPQAKKGRGRHGVGGNNADGSSASQN